MTITAVDNDIDGPDKTILVSGRTENSLGYRGPANVILTITDDDDASEVTLSISPQQIREDAGSSEITVTAELDVARWTDTDITILVEDGTAVAGIDYSSRQSLGLRIEANEKIGTGIFTFEPVADNLDEPNEIVHIKGMTQVDGLVVTAATLTLMDVNPTPEVTIKLMPEMILEAGGITAISAHLSGASSAETMIEISSAAIFPAQDSDYTLSANPILSIAPGEISSTGLVTITAEDNSVEEPNKIVKVSGQVANTLGVTGPLDGLKAIATLTILDDDKATGFALEVDPIMVNENGGSREITVTANLDVQRSMETVIMISVDGGTATVGEDFEAIPPFPLIISPNQLQGTETFTLTPMNDFIHELDEKITIHGRGPTPELSETRTSLTILDDDPLITLAIQDTVVFEDVGEAKVRINISPAAPTVLKVPIQIIELTAKDGQDYTVPLDILEIPSGSTSEFLEIPIINDSITESLERFNVRLAAVSGIELDPGVATVTIHDNDIYRLSVRDNSAPESAEELTFSVILDPLHPSETVEVDYETSDGSATAPNDYMHVSGTLYFEPRITTKHVTVPIINDMEEELLETFTIKLSAPKHAELADGLATGTIIDHDALPVVDIEPRIRIAENEGRARFEVTLSHGQLARDTEVYFMITDETTQNLTDYLLLTENPLRFPSGQTSKFIEVEIIDDEIYEPEETFQVELIDPVNGDLGEYMAQGIIIDDEDPVTVSILDMDVSESAGEAVFSVELSGPDSQMRIFTYETEDATAEAGQDYEAVNGEVMFAPKELMKEISVPILDDLESEPTEFFLVRLSGDGIADGEAHGTIQDDDDLLTVSIHDMRAMEGAGLILLPVQLNRPSSRLVTVQFESSDVTANAESDYVSSRGIVIFEPGSTDGKIRIQILEDTEVEPEETFEVTLSNARHAALGKGTGIGTIVDNDGESNVSVQSVTVSRSEAIFEMNLSKPSTLPVLISYATEDGTALAGEDYEPTAGQVTFAPGEVSKTIDVKLLSGERIWEAKTFALVVLSAVNAEVAQARTEAVMEEKSEESIQNAYVARVLRTWASQLVDALSRRMEGMAQCQIPDLTWLRDGRERWSLGEIFRGCGAEFTQGGWSVWGQGAYSRMRGQDGALSLSSDVTTMLLGADYAWRQGWMAGLVAAQSWDQGMYETPSRSGTASSRLTGFYPYVSYQTGAGMRAWMLLGLGRGESELETLETELNAALVALGLTGTLTGSTTGRLGYEVDAFWATADMETGTDLGVRRVRAGVEGSLRLGAGMEPYLETALRQDGGDAETGMGMELGGGMRWSASQLRAEVGGRTLVLHTDEGLREWGLMGSVEYGTPGGLGPLMRVRPLWGNVYGGDLWREAPLHSMSVGSADQRVEMELGYGVPIQKSIGQSIVGMTVDPSGRAYRVGYNLRMRQGLQVSVATTARTMEENEGPYSYGISARMDMKW